MEQRKGTAGMAEKTEKRAIKPQYLSQFSVTSPVVMGPPRFHLCFHTRWMALGKFLSF